jgi:endonuclease/exonuclease/phosphatase family metal-dependent hydrolase
VSASNAHDVLHIGSYNIHGCVGADTRYDPDRVAAVIRELDCDTVGLQEVDGRFDGDTGGGHPDAAQTTLRQLQDLASATGMKPIAVFTHSATPPRIRKTNALLTTREVRDVRSHDLTFVGREPRSALDVELRVGGHAVRIIVTHLGLHPHERRFQVQRLLEVLRTIPDEQAIVVMGDINEWWPAGRPLRWIHEMLGEQPGKRSFPVWAPLLALDRIWSRPRGALHEFQVHRSHAARLASDHFPVKGTVALPGALV